MQNNRRVFFYPISFSPSISSNSITLKSFRRDIYRPITGKERLFGQTPLDPPRQLIKFDIPSESLASGAGTCRRHVSLVLKNVGPRIGETLVLYAIQFYGERAFELRADAEDVELHLMEESKGWTTTCIPISIDPVKECSIWLEDLCDDDDEALVLHDCFHVFHKLCLWRWVWTKSSCPLCRHPIYRSPKF